MMRLASSLIVAIAILAAGCSADGDESVTDTGRLVLWTEDSIGVLEDGESTDLEVDGAVSQVTAGSGGTLVWTRIEPDPPAVDAVIEAAGRITIDTPTVPFFYEWSPSGDRVALLGNAPSGAGLLFGLIDVETEELTTLESPPPFFFDWSPDGTSLIAHVGGAALRVIDAETGEIEDLPVQTGAFPAPIWTDRGIVAAIEVGPTVSGAIVPIGLQSAASEIVLIDPQDASRTTLAGVDGPVRMFASEDALALAVGTSGTQRIEVVGWDGEQRGTFGQGSIDLVQWSPDGSSLLWTERDGDGALVPMTWTNGETAAHAPFRPSAEFANAYLPFWDQYDRTISMWNLDSSAFSLPTDTGVVVYELTGDTTTYPDWSMGIWTVAGSEG